MTENDDIRALTQSVASLHAAVTQEREDLLAKIRELSELVSELIDALEGEVEGEVENG